MNDSPLPRLAVPVLVVLAAGLRAQEGAAADEHVYRSESEGFRIEKPGAGWVFAAETDAADSSFKLVLRPRGDPGVIETSVKVSPAIGADDSAARLLERARQRIAGKAQYADVEVTSERIASRDAPGISVVFSSVDGSKYQIQQRYVVDHGLRYVLQCHAPLSSFAEHRGAFDEILGTFRVVAPSKELAAERRVRGLAARCGSEVDWILNWEDAATRARAEDKLVLVTVRSLPGFAITDQMRTGPFMHPDVIELVRERFVAMRLGKTTPAPFRSQQSYGMSGSTFGNAILVVTPDGDVVHETFSVQAHAVYDFLLEATARHIAADADAPVDGDRLDRAELALRRGNLDEAADQLADASSVRGYRLRASLHRRLRRGGQALADLERARRADREGRHTAEIALEQVVVWLRLGRDDEARAALDGILGDENASVHVARAMFWRAICSHREGQLDEVRELCRRLMAEHPDSRWAWAAAALVSSTAFEIGVAVRTEWPTEDVLRSLRTPPAERLEVAKLRRVERGAVAFLLASQRQDGSWISPAEVHVSGAALPHPFVIAVTSICGMSLLQPRQTPACRTAVERALEFVLDAHERGKRGETKVLFMDYAVWSKAWSLWFLAECRDAGLGDAAVLDAAMGELVGDLAARQKPGGGWSYYVTRDLASGSVAAESISFTTANVVLALLRAAEIDVAVPAAVTEAALACLERMRNSNGAFDYMRSPGDGKRSRVTPRPGAAGRGPVCDLALLRGGRGSVDQIREALKIFGTHRAGLAKELGKVLMHAGPDGQGCHYLMFDYAFAAAAVRVLPEEERAPHRAWLLDLILNARSVEGGFRDTPLNGWPYGTAMALLAIRDLKR